MRSSAQDARRCLEENEEFTLDVGEGEGVRRRDLSLQRLEAALRAHDDALSTADPRVAKRARKSDVTCHGDVVVKESIPFGRIGRVKDRLAPRRHDAGYRYAYRLGLEGVATARPFAWIRRAGRVFTLYADLSDLPRLDHVVRTLYGVPDREEQGRLRDTVADWLGGLHAGGVYHGDLKGSNVLVRRLETGFELPLIDTDRVRFLSQPVDDRRREKNLAQLAASMPISVTPSERLRWYRRYVRIATTQRKERAVVRKVAAAVATKTRVVDEPIE